MNPLFKANKQSHPLKKKNTQTKTKTQKTHQKLRERKEMVKGRNSWGIILACLQFPEKLVKYIQTSLFKHLDDTRFCQNQAMSNQYNFIPWQSYTGEKE